MTRRNANKLWLAGITAAACITAILGALSLKYAFDRPFGYLNGGHPLWILTQVLGCLAVAAALVYPIVALRRENYSPDYKNSPLLDFASLFAASALALDAVSGYLRYREQLQKLLAIKAGLALLAALFFLVLFLCRGSSNPLVTFLAAMTAVWAVIESFYAYFDPDFNMSSPFRKYPPLPCIMLAFLFLYETKVAAKRGKRIFLLIGAATGCVLSLAVGGATVIAYLFSLNREGLPVTDGVWMIALGLYAFARLRQQILIK